MKKSLMTLGRELDSRIARFQSSRAKAARKWSDARLDRELQKFADLEIAIERAPARSLAELKVKASLAAWLGGGEVTSATVGCKLAASIIRDVLSLSAPRRSLSH